MFYADWPIGELRIEAATADLVKILNRRAILERDREVQRATADALQEIDTPDARKAYQNWKSAVINCQISHLAPNWTIMNASSSTSNK